MAGEDVLEPGIVERGSVEGLREVGERDRIRTVLRRTHLTRRDVLSRTSDCCSQQQQQQRCQLPAHLPAML
eukprot:768635-Hanusia_phi.AAC.1